MIPFPERPDLDPPVQPYIPPTPGCPECAARLDGECCDSCLDREIDARNDPDPTGGDGDDD